MNDQENFQGWIASISNGSTIFETPMEPGKLSPWQALLRRLKNEDLRITLLRLQISGMTLISMREAEGYLQCIEIAKSVQTGNELIRRGLGSIIGGKVYLTWIDEHRNIWQDVRPLEDMRIHSTLA